MPVGALQKNFYIENYSILWVFVLPSLLDVPCVSH